MQYYVNQYKIQSGRRILYIILYKVPLLTGNYPIFKSCTQSLYSQEKIDLIHDLTIRGELGRLKVMLDRKIWITGRIQCILNCTKSAFNGTVYGGLRQQPKKSK